MITNLKIPSGTSDAGHGINLYGWVYVDRRDPGYHVCWDLTLWDRKPDGWGGVAYATYEYWSDVAERWVKKEPHLMLGTVDGSGNRKHMSYGERGLAHVRNFYVYTCRKQATNDIWFDHCSGNG